MTPAEKAWSAPDDDVEEQAAKWLARRDRGLTRSEQAELSSWLNVHPSHAIALGELETAFRALDGAAHLCPPGVRPNPDWLLTRENVPVPAIPGPSPAEHSRAETRLLRLPALIAFGAAAAAVVALGVFLRDSPTAVPPRGAGTVVRQMPRQMLLPDGSMVDLNDGAHVDVAFTAAERRIRLASGEAHFTVSRDSVRPFLVDTGEVVIRAVGTAFNVRRDGSAIEVVVTAGLVRVDDAEGVSLVRLPDKVDLRHHEGLVAAGYGITIAIENGAPQPASVRPVEPNYAEHALAWRSVWLEFVEMRLSDVVVEFNRHNSVRLRVADEETGTVIVTGRFRADGVDAFVRLLDAGFGVTASVGTDGATLLRLQRRTGSEGAVH